MTNTPQYDVLMDFDDVIYPWSKTAHAICERAGITNGNEISQWQFWKDYGCTSEELWDVLGSATISGELYEAWPIDGALEQLRRLRYAGHRVHIVTARGFGPTGALVQALTRDYINAWGVALDSLTFTKHKPDVRSDFALDDGFHNYVDLDDAGSWVVLLSTVHNRDFTTHNDLPVRRVDSVSEFTDMVLTVATGQPVNYTEIENDYLDMEEAA